MTPTRRCAALLLLWAGCGSDDAADDPVGSQECLGIVACGGEPTGAWVVDEPCFPEGYPEIASDPRCPDATNEIVDYLASGTLELRDDGTYEIDTSAETDQELRIPMDCIGPTPDLCQIYGDAIATLGGGEASCDVSGSTCQCSVTVGADLQETGTWSTTGTDLTLTPDGGEPRSESYCVQSDTLGITGEEPSGKPIRLLMRRTS